MVEIKELPDEPPAPPKDAVEKRKPQPTVVQTTGEKIKVFRRPYAHHLFNNKADEFCSECLKEPELQGKLFQCTGCNFVKYCSKECQKMGWRLHKMECKRLQKSFPNLPLSDVLFLSKVLDRKELIEKNGDKYGYEMARPLSSLIGHENDVRKDKERMEKFKKIFQKIQTFRDEALNGDIFFDIYCKSMVNSLTVQSMKGIEVGILLDLGVSQYNHSCRPNCSIMFDGYYVFLRPLTSDINTEDPKTATISYTDVGRSRYQRRRELQEKWFFECHCERCEDPEDDILTALRCKNILCDGAVLISEDMEPKAVKCKKCNTVADIEYVIRGQQTMLELPVRYSTEDKVDELKGHLERARPILHEKNVYLNRLETAIVQLSGKLGDNIASLYSKVQQTFSACFPATEKNKVNELVEKCAELIRKGQRKEAVPFAFDAMCILEAQAGLAHPNYLRVLALWTFLDKQPEKTNKELLELTQLEDGGDIKPIDITQFLNDTPVEASK
ncbi:unnamed protein product [Bursaphelenchus okinawaensis]|uniref:MYND-type domain-containing protein n=1 Tax=Bursaphelenchus okinawaensis TaxID=465554 RepID=A0A811KSN0_9BILA|nr:unnamed protein product [Bursaphelenchus okinawaensis]CAG9111508.1 unnamed protein product [Bursaphelenchus okinawaensis]